MTKQLTLNQVVNEIKPASRSRPVVKEQTDQAPSKPTSIEAALQKKKTLEKEILSLEKQIFALETSYLENTAQIGDLVRGWGDIATALSAVSGSGTAVSGTSSAAAAAAAHMKKRKVMDSERIFSSSSVSARESLMQTSGVGGDDQDGTDDFFTVGRPSKLHKSLPNSTKKRSVGRKKSIAAPRPSDPVLAPGLVEPLFLQEDIADNQV